MFGSRLRSTPVLFGLTLLGAAAVPGLWAGCGVSVASLCDRACECEGCSKSERDECIDAFDDGARAAEDKGCSDQYDAVLSCYDSELECRDDHVDVDGCDSEEEALEKCLGNKVVVGGSGGSGGSGGGSCDFTDDGVCDEPDVCPPGTDVNDCSGTTCGDYGYPCEDNSECCSGLYCDVDFGECTDAVSCGDVGDVCADDLDCCDGLVCSTQNQCE